MRLTSKALLLFWVLSITPVLAKERPTAISDDTILLTRVPHNFDMTLNIVKDVLKDNNFKVAHVQRCDGGLKQMGYESDKYRVVFFGRHNEVREMSKTYPELIPFMPFKILIYAEGKESVVSILSPEALKPMMKDELILKKLDQWKDEFVNILQQTKNAPYPKPAH
ncbi:MAG: DUF302 domain-containing protein [Cocleimonas sp.]